MMEDQSNATVFVDIEELQNFLKSNEDLNSSSCRTCNTESKTASTICKVQNFIRDVYKSDYEPVVVCIGPYHHGKENLRDMEKAKWNCLDYILKANPEKTLRDYTKALWELYPLARSYYPDKTEIHSHNFLHLLLLDGCFIIASVCGVEWSSENTNAMFGNLDKELDPLDYSLVTRDFLLAENQIPFFIVKRIYELFTGSENICPLLSEKIAIFVEDILHDIPKPIKKSERPRDFDNLLHLCHMYFRPTITGDLGAEQLENDDNPQLIQWHQAVEYHIAGVKFEKREFDLNNPHCLLDVSFSDDVLKIPYIFIDEITATMFRNLIDLEQTKPQHGNHISAFILFISQLVSTNEDVSLLVSKGIIGHHFESEEEVSNIFWSLGECVTFDFYGNLYLKDIQQNLEALYRSRMKWSVGWLRRAKSAIQTFI